MPALSIRTPDSFILERIFRPTFRGLSINPKLIARGILFGAMASGLAGVMCFTRFFARQPGFDLDAGGLLAIAVLFLFWPLLYSPFVWSGMKRKIGMEAPWSSVLMRLYAVFVAFVAIVGGVLAYTSEPASNVIDLTDVRISFAFLSIMFIMTMIACYVADCERQEA